MVALLCLAQQNQVVGAAHSRFHVGLIRRAVAVGFFAAVVAAAFGDVNFTTDDGFDVALAGFVEKIRSCEKIAMIGDGHRGHFLSRRFVEKFTRFAGPVKQAVIGVYVQMYELRLPHKTILRLSREICITQTEFPKARKAPVRVTLLNS